ncbi:hypothetical protein L6278_03445 [Candidatus Parcubacteria bacterium]|nr:hypothetical protein [Patescibacteria group bacterium]MCG2687157.1 hypothetical protein [Candidatus Parcubacteria bacterium]
MLREKTILQKIFKKDDEVPINEDKTEIADQVEQPEEKDGLSEKETIEKFFNRIEDYMNPPRLSVFKQELGINWNKLEILGNENQKQKLVKLTDKYIDYTLDKSKTLDEQNPYGQAGALKEIVKLIEEVFSKAGGYTKEKEEKLNKMKERVKEIQSTYEK